MENGENVVMTSVACLYGKLVMSCGMNFFKFSKGTIIYYTHVSVGITLASNGEHVFID